jgi:4-hydroxybenzoate polyprenyltransferase
MTSRDVLVLLRPEHWVKNLFLFIPAFFAARLADPSVLLRAITGFVAFSLTASAVYILNDLADAEHDRRHPKKSKRPVASGVIGLPLALTFMVILLGISTSMAAWLGPRVLMFTVLYFLSNVAYSFLLKHIAIVDISLIGVGFLLRVFAGGAATGVAVSQWLTVLTFLLALILALAKRRGEYLIEAQQGGTTFRKSLEGYNLQFLDMSIVVCSTVAIVAYLMYCFSPEVTERIGSHQIYYTAFFAVVGILRYLQLTWVYEKTESPTRALLTDTFLQLVLLGWVGCFVGLLYGRH